MKRIISESDLRSFIKKEVRGIVNERLGAVDAEGLSINKYVSNGWQNVDISPQSFNKSPGFDRPGPDPEGDEEERNEFLQDEDLSDVEINITSTYLPDGGIATGIDIDKFIYQDYCPRNGKELGMVINYISNEINDKKTIEKLWNIFRKEYNKQEKKNEIEEF